VPVGNDCCRFIGSVCIIAVSAQVEIVVNHNRTSDAQSDYREMTQGVETGVYWTKKVETSGKDYVGLALATPDFGPR
jgi:uncharacterized protein (DUF736 family)